jgi:virginiamycin A acetyltransferase
MKHLLKSLATGIALALTAPAGLLWRFARLFSVSDGLFHDLSQLHSLIPGLPGDYLRKGFYYWTLSHCSLDVKISFGTLVAHPETEIHEGVYIGPYCLIGTAIIGPHSTLGSAVHVLSGKRQHNFDLLNVPIQDQGGRFDRISIGSNSWLGNGSIVMADVGRHSIIGAGSVVTSAVNELCIVAGNPAKVLRQRRQRASKEDSFEREDQSIRAGRQ